MDTLLGILVFLFGTIVGSFLNVVILRYNTGKGTGGRSGCFSCGATLKWYELVPILSWLALRGRCSSCGSKISAQYPLVEAGTGLLFFLSYQKIASLPFQEASLSLLFFAAVWSLLTVIFVYDLRHKIIPDGPVYFFAALSLGMLIFREGNALLSLPGLLDLLAGPLFFLPFFLLWYFQEGDGSASATASSRSASAGSSALSAGLRPSCSVSGPAQQSRFSGCSSPASPPQYTCLE